MTVFFFFSSRRRHTRYWRDWSSDVCSSDLTWIEGTLPRIPEALGNAEPTVLSRGVRWAAAGVTQKPETVSHVTVRAENAEHAKALVELLAKATAFVQLTAPAAAPADEAAAKQAADAMTPKLQGDTIKRS